MSAMRPNSLRLIVENRLGVHGLTANVPFEANTLPLMTDLVTAALGYPSNKLVHRPAVFIQR
jgi:LysR family transcriptional regulator, nitrogen assimilation regulatory protein